MIPKTLLKLTCSTFLFASIIFAQTDVSSQVEYLPFEQSGSALPFIEKIYSNSLQDLKRERLRLNSLKDAYLQVKKIFSYMQTSEKSNSIKHNFYSVPQQTGLKCVSHAITNTLNAILKAHFPNKDINISSAEDGVYQYLRYNHDFYAPNEQSEGLISESMMNILKNALKPESMQTCQHCLLITSNGYYINKYKDEQDTTLHPILALASLNKNGMSAKIGNKHYRIFLEHYLGLENNLVYGSGENFGFASFPLIASELYSIKNTSKSHAIDTSFLAKTLKKGIPIIAYLNTYDTIADSINKQHYYTGGPFGHAVTIFDYDEKNEVFLVSDSLSQAEYHENQNHSFLRVPADNLAKKIVGLYPILALKLKELEYEGGLQVVKTTILKTANYVTAQKNQSLDEIHNALLTVNHGIPMIPNSRY